jgi:hypothetical protein
MMESKATCVDGHWKGGIRFERHERVVNLKQAKRCYQVASTIQTPRSLAALGCQAKVHDVAPDEDVAMHKNLIMVRLSLIGFVCIVQSEPRLVQNAQWVD